jgi:hypothetical protein
MPWSPSRATAVRSWWLLPEAIFKTTLRRQWALNIELFLNRTDLSAA